MNDKSFHHQKAVRGFFLFTPMNGTSAFRGLFSRKNNQKTISKALDILTLFFLLFGQLSVSWAAESAETPSDTIFLVTPQILESKIKEVESTTTIEKEAKKNLLELYRKSLGNLEQEKANSTLADKFMQAIETSPTETQRIRESIQKVEQLPVETGSEVSEEMTLKDVEQQLLKAKANFAVIEAKIATITRQFAAQNERPAKASQRLTEIKKMEEELVASSKAQPPAGESPQMVEARNWTHQTQLQALHAETKMLNQELVSMPVLLELTNAQKLEAVGELGRAQFLMQHLEAKVNQGRQAEAAKSIKQAEVAMQQVADRPKVLQQEAALNTALSNELQSSITALEHTTAEKDKLADELKSLKEELSNTKQKIALAGLSQALGRVLLNQKRSLPNLRLLKKKITGNEAMIAETGLHQFQHEEERKKLSDGAATISELTAGSPPDEAEKIETELRGLLDSRKELLDKIIVSNQNLLGLLTELDIVYHQLLTTVISYDSFLSEHLLWMRSTPPFKITELVGLPQEIAGFLSPTPWLTTLKLLTAQKDFSSSIALVSLIIVALFMSKQRVASILENLVRQAGNPVTYRFTLPLKALSLSLLLALPWPLLFAFLGWQIQALADPTDFSRAVGTGLLKVSYRLYLLMSLRTLIRPKGLAASFFHWSDDTLQLLRRESRFLITTLLPAIFITQLSYTANYHTNSTAILARIAFIVTTGIMGTSLYRILHPKTGVWQGNLEDQPHRVLAFLYHAFFLLLMLLFTLSSGLIVTGYVITANILLVKLIDTLWFALGIIVYHQLGEQWLLHTRRKIVINRAQKQSSKAHIAEENGKSMDADKDTANVISEPTEDLAALTANSRKLLDTVMTIISLTLLWLVWADVLPALRIFNEFTLWHYSATVNGQPTQMPVSVTDAGLAVLTGIVTMTVIRHFPALLEIVLLQHLDMPQGSRYTTKTLSRYVLGGFGATLVAGQLGFSWSQIQWLVAALSVGIGFGLQEIVANFISGIIILFERPIRVGDVITIGATDGVVTRIRIRATTIRDFDRKELLVPNKEFISGHLLNWSLSDPVIRIRVPVGLAYGGDVQKALALMVEAARENTMVLADPEPIATFDSFGDNALALTLRCFIGSVNDRVPATSVLHQIIDRKFREAGLSIAFPQRDVHLDTSRPLDIRIHPGREALLPDDASPEQA